MRHCLPACLVLASLASPALAGDASGADATIELERHHTTNALDGPVAVPDWYGLLRGTLKHAITIPDGMLRVSAAAQASRHDRIHIEDDRGMSLAVEATRRLNPRTEMRGTLSWRRYSEGDDLLIENTIVGIRTLTDTMAAGLEVGFDLGGDTVLTLAASDTLELPRKTRFQLDVLPPTRLDPERNRINLAAQLMRRTAPLSYGLKAQGEWADVATQGIPPIGYSYALTTLQADAAYKIGNGTTVSGTLGAQWLRAEQGLYQALRPTLSLEYSQTFANGIALRGSLAARYETVDTDDPLASWLKRAEIEVKAPITPRLTLGGGVFAEDRQNVALANHQRSRGAYAQLVYKATGTLSLIVQAGYTREAMTVIDVEKDAFDTYIGLKKEI